MAKKGAPTKLNDEVQHKIITAIKQGNYIETAASYAGINKSSLYLWLKKGEREKQRVEKNSRYKIKKSEEIYVNFSNAVEKALAEAEMRDVIRIDKAANENWQAAAWRLERKFPKKWGRKIEHTATVKTEIHNLSDEEKKKRIKELREKFKDE